MIERGTILKCITGKFHGLEENHLYVCLKSEKEGYLEMITITEGLHTIRYSLHCFKVIMEP